MLNNISFLHIDKGQMSQTQVLERTLFNKFTNTISLNKKLIQTGNDNSTLDILLCQGLQKAETKK